jgi:ureidoglycolate hydrolase
MFERHAFTTQAFIPMAKGEWGAGVGEPAMARTEGEGGMLVIVALNGPGQSSPCRPRLRVGNRDGD